MKTTKFDVHDFLKTEQEQASYMAAALEDGDPSLIAAAVGDIARARGASAFARDSDISRETIYKQFRPGGNPRLDTLAKAMRALGLRLTLAPVDLGKPASPRAR